MNKIYKVIWSKTKNCYVVVSEYAKRNGKCSSSMNKKLIAAFLAAGTVLSVNGHAWAADTDPATQADIAALQSQIETLQKYVSIITSPDSTGATASGYNSIAIGPNASTTIGPNALATGDEAMIAIGYGSKALNSNPNTQTLFKAMAVGVHSYADGESAIAIGYGSKALNSNPGTGSGQFGKLSSAMAVGVNSYADGERATAIGYGAFAQGMDALTIGRSHEIADADGKKGAVGTNAIAIGGQTVAYGSNAEAVGSHSRAIGDSAVALGQNTWATEDYATASGSKSQAIGIQSTANGAYSGANTASVAVGGFAQAGTTITSGVVETIDGANFTTAIGYGSHANVQRSVALGAKSVADRAKGEFSSDNSGTAVNGKNAYDPIADGKVHDEEDTSPTWVSTAGAVSLGGMVDTVDADGNDTTIQFTRQITNVAAGSAETDAVNVAQLKQVVSAVDDSAIHFYSVNSTDSEAGNYNNNGATGTDALAAGVNASATGDNAIAIGTSADAKLVNSIAIGNGASMPKDDADAAIAIGYNSSVVSGAFGGVALGAYSVAQIASGQVGYDPLGDSHRTDTTGVWKATAAAVSVGGGTVTVEDDEGGSTSYKVTRQITNVAAGYRDTDAVNVAQLKNAGVRYYSVNSSSRDTGSNFNNEGATGEEALAAGAYAKAIGNGSIAIGNNAVAYNKGTIAIGDGARAGDPEGTESFDNTIAIGRNAVATGRGAIALGDQVEAAGDRAFAHGRIAKNTIKNPDGTTVTVDVPVAANGKSATAFGAGTTAGLKEADRQALLEKLIEEHQVSSVGEEESYGESATAWGMLTTATGSQATAFGESTIAYGFDSTAFGTRTIATGRAATAFGKGTLADGYQSTAFGEKSEARGNNSLAFGNQSKAIGINSTAFGDTTIAGKINLLGATLNDTAFGNKTEATGGVSTAFGDSTHATGYGSTAFGFGTTAKGRDSVAWGGDGIRAYRGGTAEGDSSTAFGLYTKASGNTSTAFGYSTQASGSYSTAFGLYAKAQGYNSAAFGYSSTVTETGTNGVAWGGDTTNALKGGTASGMAATAFGVKTTASASYATAWGSTNTASGDAATAFGNLTEASATTATAFGANTVANATNATAFGQGSSTIKNTASGVAATAFGNLTLASANMATAFGQYTEAKAKGATAFGIGTVDEKVTASGIGATAFGSKTVAAGDYATAFGIGSKAYGENSLAALGGTTGKVKDVTDDEGTVTGQTVDINAVGAIAVGQGAVAQESHNIALGQNAKALGKNSIAIGTGHIVRGSNSGAFGDPNVVNADASYIVGNNSTIDGSNTEDEITVENAFVVGNNSAVDKTGGIILGSNAAVSVENGLALGNGTQVAYEGSVALGQGSKVLETDAPTAGGYNPITGSTTYTDNTKTWTATDGPVSVGSSSVTRQIKYVAAGSADTDAVNVAQLKQVAKAVDDSKIHYFAVNSDRTTAGSNYNNDGAAGDDGIAIGQGAHSVNTKPYAHDNGGYGVKYNSMAVGMDSYADGEKAIAMGAHAYAEGLDSLTIGSSVMQIDDDGNELGKGAMGTNAIAIGAQALAKENYATAVGGYSRAVGDGTVALGPQSWATDDYAIAVGMQSRALGNTSTVLGAYSGANDSSVAIGGFSQAGTEVDDDDNIVPIDDVANATAIGYESQATGSDSTATGASSLAEKDFTTATGASSQATGSSSTATGAFSSAEKDYTTATGYFSQATGYDATATGANSLAEKDYTTATGESSQATAEYATATGYSSQASGENATATGANSQATANYTTATGTYSNAGASYGTAIGYNSTAAKTASTAVGSDSNAAGAYSTAMGYNSKAVGNETVALGSTSVAKRAKANGDAGAGYDVTTGTYYAGADKTSATWTSTLGSVSVGGKEADTDAAIGSKATATRQITGLAAGTADTDAVNVAQLKQVKTAIDAATTHYYSTNDSVPSLGEVHKANYKNDGATGTDSLAAGVAVGTNALFSTVTGSYSSIEAEATTSPTAINHQGTGAAVYGSFNDVGAAEDIAYDGVGNSIVGLSNSTSNANGALIFGTGNSITNSYGALDDDQISELQTAYGVYAAAVKLRGVDSPAAKNAYDAFKAKMDAFGVSAPLVSGDVLAIGGANTAENAVKSSMIGVKNTITGTTDAPVEFNSSIGYNNTIKNGSNNSIIGTNRTISGVAGAIVLGSAKNETTTSVANAVVIGTDANVKVADGVALGSGSVTAAKVSTTSGYDVSTGTASIDTSSTWLPTLGEVSVGGGTITLDDGEGGTTTKTNTRRITNLAAGSDPTDAVNVAQLKAARVEVKAGPDNVTVDVDESVTDHTAYIVNVEDLGYKVNGTAATPVAIKEGINFVDGTGTTAELKTVDGKEAVTFNTKPMTFGGESGGTFDVNLDNSDAPVKVVGDGGVVKTETDATNKTIKVSVDKDAIIGEVGLKFAGDDESAISKANGEQLDIVGGKAKSDLASEDNIGVYNDEGKLKINLAKAVTGIDSVTAGDYVKAGGTTINDDGLTVTGGPVVTKTSVDVADNKITSVAAGSDPTDAVNVSQLKASQVKLTEGTNTDLVAVTDEADGHTTYTVNAYDTKIEEGTGVSVTGGDLGEGNVRTYTVGLSEETQGQIDSALYTLTTAVDGDVAQTLDKENTQANFITGDNIELTPSTDGITIATKNDVTFNTVTATTYNAGATVLNEGGLTISEGPVVTKTSVDVADNKITSVAAGSDPTDAVNVSQLKAAQASAKTEVKAGNNVNVTPSEDKTDGHAIFTVDGLKTVITSNDETVTITGGEAGEDGVITYDLSVEKTVDTDTTYTFTPEKVTEAEKKAGVVSKTTVTENKPDGTTTDVATIIDTDTNTVLDTASDGLTLDKSGLTLSVKDTDGNEVASTISLEDLKENIDTNTVLDTASDGLTLDKSGLTLSVKDTDGNEVTSTISLEDLKENIDTNTHTSVVDDKKGYITVEKTADATETAGPEYTVSLDTDKLKEAIDTNTVLDTASDGLTLNEKGLTLSVKDTDGNEVTSTISLEDLKENIDTNTHTSVVDDKKGYITVEKTADATETAGPEYTVSLDTDKLKEAIDTNTVLDTASDGLKLDDKNLTLSVKDTDGNEVASTVALADLQEKIDTNTVLDTASDGLKLDDKNLTLSVKDTDGNEVTSNVTLDDLKEKIDTTNKEIVVEGGTEKTITITDSDGNEITSTFTDINTNTSVVGDNNYVTVEKTKDATETEGPEYTVSLDTDKLKEKIDTTNKEIVVEGGTEKTITITDSDGNEITSTFTDIDTRNTVTAGDNVTVTEDKNADGSINYTISAKAPAANVKVIDGENTTVTEGTDGDYKTYAVNVKADGQIASGDTNIVTGDTIYKEVHVDNGTYIQEGNTVGENLTVLDEAITNNTKNINNLGNEINRVDSRAKKGIAGAAALAALHPMDFDPDSKLTFAAGVGNYRGANAAAVGAFYRPDERVMFSMGGTFGNGENMVNAGVSFALDRVNRISNTRTAMAHEIVELKGHIAKQDEQIAKLTALVNKLVGPENAISDASMFPDVPENHWAYEYVADLQRRGALVGYPDGLFKGDRAMTRYEFAAMLDRALQNGVKLDERATKEFEPELGRIYVQRISGQDNSRNKIERTRVNNYDKATRDMYGSKISTAAPAKAASK